MKKSLREKYSRIRSCMDEDKRAAENLRICEEVLNLKCYDEAETVFIYVSTGDEVDTRGLIDRMIKDGKRVSVPLCDTKNHTMQAIEIRSLSDLSDGAYGILEPDRVLVENGELNVLGKNDIDIVVVPALAFDKSGGRLGYGGGYYDRFLADFTGVSIGLAFSECMTESLPCDEYDCRVCMVVIGR